MDEEHLAQLELPEPLGDPCLLSHQMGYYLDEEPLGDPCLLSHQMGYYLDEDQPDAEHLDVVLQELLELPPVVLVFRPLPALMEQPGQPVFPQRLV